MPPAVQDTIGLPARVSRRNLHGGISRAETDETEDEKTAEDNDDSNQGAEEEYNSDNSDYDTTDSC